MKRNFVHLHVHTEYSLLDGLSRIKPLIQRVKELGMNSLAITDHGAMYGAIEFYKNCNSLGIKPIIGMEGYITNVSLKQKSERGKIRNYHLLLLAKNYPGYKNLMTLSSIAHLEGYYYKPRIDHETLKKYSKGLICTSGCPQGEIPQALISGEYESARKIAEWYLDVFQEDFYFEMQRHKHEDFLKQAESDEIRRLISEGAEMEKVVNDGVLKLSRELGVPLVATNDSHYINKEDATAQDALVCIATGKNVSDTKRLRFIDVPSFYIKSPSEMFELFSDLPEACENTLKVSEKCELQIVLGQFFFPKIDLLEGKTPEEELADLAKAGLKEKYKEITREIKKRFDFELDVIIKKGYATYFLIFFDMSKWAREHSIPINTRGSVAGSLISYCLGITTVDPIYYNLPFERFLNPYRPSAPDIDMDIADDKREEMIDYLTKKYGKERVAQICTFGRMLARASVRDIARVLGYPYDFGDKIAKLIPIGSQGFPMTINRALEESVEFRDLYNSDNDAKKIIDLAREIEGNARHVSVHAAGVVIAPSNLTDFTPLQLEPSGEKIITQYEMHSCEDIGLVKLDVLGIRNLSILREAVELVKKTGKTIDLAKIPLNDEKTFKMLAKGETMGTFQLSGSGMTRFLVELEPERVEDIMAMIALFRPGPIANIPEYIARKKGLHPVKYYHPKMKKFLDKSFGILVYQDDLLFTALEIAGYDWESVDKFRKAVGKKIPEEMAKQHEIFVNGCIKHSKMTKKQAEGLWKLFEPFQGYGFNKAHAASYGMVAYQTSYMKANYPVEFMTALLTAESDDKEKISAAINECRRIGIKVLPPDINESETGFKIVNDPDSHEGKAIRFGLSAIKNVGVAAVEAILSARKEGKFVSFADFCGRVDSRKVNKKVLESLIKVGALSSFGNRASLLSKMEEIRLKSKPQTSKGQQDLFSSIDEVKSSSKSTSIEQTATNIPEFSDEEIQNLERQLLGFSLSAKPIIQLIEDLIRYRTHKINEISSEILIENGSIKIACVVSQIRVVITKKTASEMAFVQVEDETGTIEAVIFPKLYNETKNLWFERNPILISGKIDSREEIPLIIVDTAETAESLASKQGSLKISIPTGAKPEKLNQLKQLFSENPGNKNVILVFEEKNGYKLNLPTKVEWNKKLSRKIANILDS